MNAPRTGGSDSAAPLLLLRLFGGFRATRDSGPELAERWPRPGARALVKLLAVVPGHRLHREQAMETCWPGADTHSAAGSLRVALHAARRALEPELAPRAASSYLISEAGMLFLAPTSVRIDADEAENAATAALTDGGAAQLGSALALFTGELLPEDRYTVWTEARRSRLALQREQLLLRLAEARLAEGAAAEAAALAEQVLAASPAEELAHRVLIDASIRQGLRRRAVQQYHACRQILDTELGVRPGPEIERLHRAALAATPAAVPVTASLPAPLRVRSAPPLRGRDELLHRLLDAGGPPVRLLTGEAGIGKTRLVGEVARRAAKAGTAVLWGGGQDAQGHAPYGAFAEALDGWLAEHEARERARVGAEYPELASVLPSLGQVPPAGERSPEEERDRLFRASAALLGDLATARPVLLVLDDLHAADAGSFQLLSHLARRTADRGTPLRFLVTYREEELADGDTRRASLAHLLRQGLAAREEVGRLDRAACLAVVRDTAGATPDPRVWELSLGNPLFALELARGLADQDGGELGTVAPESVRGIVGERLVRLAPDARRIVEALSAAGGDAALSELLDVAEHGLHPAVTGAAATDALELAIAASLVEERQVVVAGRPEAGLAFRHPLVRLVCYEQLSAIRRRRLHAAFGRTVLRRRPDAVDTLASHFARADDPRAAEYLRRAAERAAALYANDTADRYYRDLVARLDVDAARARLAHSQVLRRMGHFEQAAAGLRLALAEFVRRGDHDDEVLTAARLAEIIGRTGVPRSGITLLRAHRPGPGTAAESVAAHHLARAMLCGVQGRYTAGYDAARRAQSASGQVPGLPGQGLLARSYALQATNLGLAGRFGEAREAGDLALPPAEAYGDPTLLGGVLSTLRENARRYGRLREAVGYGRRALDLADRSGDPTAAAFERANLAELRLLLREFDAARTLAEAAVTSAEDDDIWCLPYALATLARIRTRTGDAVDAAELLDRAATSADSLADRQARYEVSTARAELALAAGHPEDALRALGDARTDAPVLAAWAELLSGHPETARRLARAEVTRSQQTGERLAEVEARIALGTSLAHLTRAEEGEAELTRAESMAEALPYPAGSDRARWARGLGARPAQAGGTDGS
ncbi:ATP-binding protein [Streptomyces sp. NPDC090306]|uniref:ATP-binding protein n=1 Tax=Streptomyces sp. NPDC090306 TaxID=3365961 RepID=UPI0038285D39